MEINKKIPVLFQKLNTYDVEDEDTRFLKVKIWLMHLEENLNGSYFSKEVVENAIPSLSNTPILAYIEDNSEGEIDFSDHRQVLIVKKDGFEIKYLGKAIGVIPETNSAQFEDRLCDDGVTRTFLTVEGLIWSAKFDDAADILNRDLIKSQSMELHDDYEGEFQDDNLFHFTKISFYGACGLGIDVLPAMHNATIEVNFSFDEFKNEIQSKMEQFKLNFSTRVVDDIQNHNSEGGIVVNKSERIQQLFSLSQEQLESGLKRELAEIETIVSSYWDDWSYPRFYFVDYYVEDQIVIAEDCSNNYWLCAFKYSVNGDIVEVDNDSMYRVKIEYVPMQGADSDNDEGMAMYSAQIEHKAIEKEREFSSKLDEAVKEKDDALANVQSEFEVLKEQFSAIESEKVELEKFKASTIQAERQEAENAIFEQFSDKLTDEEMTPVKEIASTLDLDEIETKLFAIVGKKTAKFSANPAPKRISMGLGGFNREEEPKNHDDVWSEQKEKFSQQK